MSEAFVSQQCADTSLGATNYLFRTLVSTLLATQCAITPSSYWPPNQASLATNNELPEYDFIVAGGGASGAIVASRLSENPDNKVLLLEAGGNPLAESVIPGLFLNIIKSPGDWAFWAKPANACKLSPSGNCYMPRGKMLGGSSAINFMIYARGDIADYDEWGKTNGNPGWSFDEVLPYFKKFENNQNPEMADRDGGKWHGTSGPLKTSFGDFSGLVVAVEEALRGSGKAKFIDDINTNHSIGFARAQSYNWGGRRSSSAEGYLAPAANRTNLHVITGAYVTRVLFDSAGTQATGVEFTLNGQTFQAQTKKEVIVSAGSIQSPPILMRSGIGPKQHLEDNNIPVIADLPVGQNYTDHVFGHFLFSYNYSTSPLPNTLPLDALYQYVMTRTGPFATVPYMTGYVNTNFTDAPADLQFFFSNFQVNTPASTLTGFNAFVDQSQFDDWLVQKNQQRDTSILTIALLHALSRGEILMAKNSSQQNNNGENIFVDGKYLEHPDDIKSLVGGIKYFMEMVETPAFQKIGAKFEPLPFDDCNSFASGTDEYWGCYVQHVTTCGSHQTGTCRMSPGPDGVVDSECKVKGIQGLRVVDASIMPVSPRANSNAASLMIGERCSQFIKEEYNQA